MKGLPVIESDFGDLTTLFYGTLRSRLLMAAVDLKVFDHLTEPASASRVADALDCQPANTEFLLNALTACGLLQKENGAYTNRTQTDELLVTGRPAYLGEWLRLTDASMAPVLADLPGVVRTGAAPAGTGEHMNSEAECTRYTESHAATSLAGVAGRLAGLVSGVPGFTSFRKMLDLGGGPGINAMAVVSASARLTATVFDRPEIVAMARRYIDTYGFSDRVDVLAGDYLTDEFEHGYDLVMVSDTLYYAPEEIDRVLTRLYQSLVPGGAVVGVHAVLNRERTAPASAVMGLLPEALTGNGTLPEKGFLAEAMTRCGFSGVSARMVEMPLTPMEMNVGRKAC